MIWARFRWLMFAAYVFFLCTLPFTLLWGWTGCGIGGLITLVLMISLRWRAESRIAARLNMRRLSPAEAPQVFAIVTELCRRLGMPVPCLGVIDTPSLNL